MDVIQFYFSGSTTFSPQKRFDSVRKVLISLCNSTLLENLLKNNHDATQHEALPIFSYLHYWVSNFFAFVRSHRAYIARKNHKYHENIFTYP